MAASNFLIGDFLKEPCPNTWYSDEQFINFRVTGTPDVEVSYAKDGGTPVILYGGDIGYSFMTGGTGTHFITAKEKDGRQVTHSLFIRIDSVVSTLKLSSDTTTVKTSDLVIFTTTAGESDISSVEVKPEGGA